jgi:hypothetical protein
MKRLHIWHRRKVATATFSRCRPNAMNHRHSGTLCDFRYFIKITTILTFSTQNHLILTYFTHFDTTHFFYYIIVYRTNGFLSIFSESSLNIKDDKRWISFARIWISNLTVEKGLATIANFWTKVETVTDRLLYNNYNNNNNSLLNISFKHIHIFLPLILFVLLFIF